MSSAVWSSRFAKSVSDSTGRHQKQLLIDLAGTIVDGTGFVNSAPEAAGALKPLEKPGIIREISVVPAISAAHRVNQKRRHLRVARNLLLIVLAALLLPYLLAPLYRAGHPVSTLMAWR